MPKKEKEKENVQMVQPKMKCECLNGTTKRNVFLVVFIVVVVVVDIVVLKT